VGSPDELTARLGAAYGELAQSRFATAVRMLQEIAADHPDSHTAQHACGGVLSNLSAAPAAEPYLRRAHALDPTNAATRVALAFALLAQENYAEAWPLFEARYEMAGGPSRPALAFPEWRGEPLAGKRLLVWPDEGLGDQIQFFRFAQALAARDLDVALCCSPELERLFAANLRGYVAGLGERTEFPQPDYWIPSGFLPGRLGLTPQTAPQPPYLAAPGVRSVPGARIGVATHGNPAQLNDAHRSLPSDQAARLLAIPGAIGLHPEQTGVADMAETAEIVAGLDLVISVDTSISHLAAAMGRPTWILLTGVGLDWRYGFGERTPWYPQARLFRQPRFNDWPAVIDAVVSALADFPFTA
jgi:tetratricopeptide (TPR) repeat protein